MKKAIVTILIVLLIGIFAFSAWQIVSILLEYRQGEQAYESLEQFVSFPEPTASADAEEPVQQTPDVSDVPQETQPLEEQSGIQLPEVNFAALQEINPDVVGWIYIPGTNVNYPIVQGEDNDQYLYHLLTGEYNSSGSIFLEAQIPSDFTCQNNTIYGHNMKNGTMFAEILEYKSQDFYEEHPTAILLTPEKNYLVHLFSGYVTDAWGDSWQIGFTTEDFEQWLQQRMENSCFSSQVVPTARDRILSFSTCSYERVDGRFVVHGVLEEIEGK